MKVIQIGNIYEFSKKHNSVEGRVYSTKGLAPTLHKPGGGGQVPLITEKTRIRKLTPKECFRLQGWSDEKFERAALVNSDSQLYKQAGNGVTVNVIKAIAERMIRNESKN